MSNSSVLETNLPFGLKLNQVGCIKRERFEKWLNVPCFRSEDQYEEFTFSLNLRRKKKFNPQNFDVTIGCTYPHVNWVLQRTRRGYGPLNIFVTQNGDWMCHSDDREYKHFGCDGLVCINPEYYERNRERYHTALIPNGVDPTAFETRPTEIPDELRIDHDGPVILMVSALIESKRVDDAVRAVALVPDACLVVAGDGPEREKLAQLGKELLPGRHRFMGSLSAQKMHYLYHQANAFIHMSQIEPFGIVYLEAASASLPIVTHDGDVPKWILGDTALFHNSSEHEGFAAQLRSALEPENAQRLGSAARERVLRDWTWTVQARKYREHIYDVMRANGRELPDGVRAESKVKTRNTELLEV
jgi:glycosyltransferase involved in cell wall biosynthesis